MRAMVMAIMVLALAPTTAIAGGALEGPLAAPEAPAHKTVPKRIKTTKPRHAAAMATPGKQDGTPREPTASSAVAAPSDPLSFGMKWNGSNDNAEQTRVQNYNGGAQGTGAEVGMKLHF